MSLWKALIQVVFLAAIAVQVISDQCHVLVHEPWSMPYIFVPRESTVEINCTAQDRSYSPSWFINLANDTKDFPLSFIQKDELNDHGVHELPRIERPGMPPTLRLLINDTSRNNQTVIICDQSATTSSTTILFVLDPIRISLLGDTVDMGINISWSSEPQSLANAALRLLLRINKGSHSPEISLLNESYYYFTAPEGAPPCEMYNFSVTATYAGATYTGAGCSVPSPMLSTVLPSLPNISRLDSSLDYVLTKQITGFALSISFEPASYCNDYPIMNYTLEINGTRNEEIRVSVFAPNAENFTIGDNFSENVAYSFRIQVANTVGVVSTSDRHFYTTDVQVVTATLIEGVNTSIIQCEFIEDSNAAGCRIVLTTNNGEQDYYNLTKNQNTNLTVIAVTLELPPSCYIGVKAFDIESDGSVGTLAIPGHITNFPQVQCTPATLPVKPSSSGILWEAWIIALVVVISAVVVSILSVVIIVIVGVCKSKKVRASIRAWCRCPSLYSTDNNDSDHTHYYEQIIVSPGNEVHGVSTDSIETTHNDVYGVKTDGIETTHNEMYGVNTDGIEITPNLVYGVNTDCIETTPNLVYGVNTDCIETTPNLVYGVNTDCIETKPNLVYGVNTDCIETTPNLVYGVSTDGIETTPNLVYGVSIDGIETTPNGVYGVSTDSIKRITQ